MRIENNFCASLKPRLDSIERDMEEKIRRWEEERDNIKHWRENETSPDKTNQTIISKNKRY